ncbi:hypothetical protein OF83DRAFT_1275283 [Amylostereum chailletii]|nr:hypothetical protein OF83DRAFT_1275283 [Amylostereum chailletii]
MSSRGPKLNPDKSAAGIAVDPRTLDRVIPESKRSDGSVRKERKIRPGFTPQEDVKLFRGSRQQTMDSRALPKGHIIGWVPPTPPASATDKSDLSKAAAKNAKQREKRKEKASQDQRPVKDNWDSEEEAVSSAGGKESPAAAKPTNASEEGAKKGGHTNDAPNWATAPDTAETIAVKARKTASSTATADAIADKLGELSV